MSSMTATGDYPLLNEYYGQVVPRSVEAGFVALSYVVSLIGAGATLELINRRTSPKGLYNHMLLVGAAITMGGISIWCMHFIGNRAIRMGNGAIELQIAYSSGFTALSFFVPIFVLLVAFVVSGTSNVVSWWRTSLGGSLAGGAICGMHYLGNASINNYVCIYSYVNVIGAALIAVAASITALAMFFVFRAQWTSSWWKRAASAVLLAGAVSGMHWCALVGTQYRLKSLVPVHNQASRNTTIIIVICLSVGACFIMAGTFIYTARVLSRYASKAQQVVLATAIFDKQGRVLVSPEGLLPSEKITDSFLEKTPSDTFSIAHPLFQWMFQASRNWANISTVVNVMVDHLSRLPHGDRDVSRNGIKLIDERGELVENYDIIFKELFCAAARALAEKTKSNLTHVGILWDEILPTGTGGDVRRVPAQRKGRPDSGSDDTLAEKGEAQRRMQELYRGSLMFLVRRVESQRDITDLEAAGYRFADISQVAGIIHSSMQIKTDNMATKLSHMAQYSQEENSRLAPGVHLGFFAIRARVGGGFDVLVRKGTRHLLPSMEMPFEQTHLEPSQRNMLRSFDGLTPSQVANKLQNRQHMTKQDQKFAQHFLTSLGLLRGHIEDEIFEESTFTSRIVQVPCRPGTSASSPATCSLLTFKLVVPIHLHVACPNVEFIPFTLFKVHQLVYRDSPYNLIFSRSVHREISPILNAVPASNIYLTRTKSAGEVQHHSFGGSTGDKLRRLRDKLKRDSNAGGAVDSDGNPIPTVLYRHRSGENEGDSNRSSSTLKLWNPDSNQNSEDRDKKRTGSNVTDIDMDEDRTPNPSSTFDLGEPTYTSETHNVGGSFGGIMVSQEITVNVETGVVDPSDLRRKSTSCVATIPIRADQKGGDQAIEMQPWGDKAVGVTVQAETLGSETTTFVDELFAVCVHGPR
ncbi:hypothetical protein DL546_009270 [Coniochaeta pulveracea]|uniref:MHYT domain-containing protein n=1 Tax=Coniochaeta pulveracea TaxID=177199 RepID=A0A420YHZ1_9PEZI|nr:hypothetical protein DL546_009270 [Coniochaeta pulveracea]